MLIFQETANSLLTPAATGAEALVSSVVLWLVLIAEIVAAILIGLGILLTVIRVIRVLRRPKYQRYEKTRLTLARFLALALEFQLAADVLATAIAPSWNQIGKLAAIAVIRTALNYFLAREMKEEAQEASAAPASLEELGSEA